MRHLIRMLALATVALLILVAAAPGASAHRNDESYLYLDVAESTLTGRVEMPYPDVRQVLGLRLAGTDAEVRAEIEARLDDLIAYAAARTEVGSAGAVWELDFEGYELLDDGDVDPNGLGYVILPFDVRLPGESVPQIIEATFTPFLDEIDDRNNILLVSNDWRRGVFDEEANELIVFTSSDRSGSVDLGNPSQWKNFRASIDLGVDHIRTGPDHIFFVLVLLLPAVLVGTASGWQPAPSFGSALWRILKIVTTFTVAHSLTFTLAGMDLLPLPPSRLVEVVIALSIAAAAVHNIRPVFHNREWAIAFVFGLFHGMGFASLVEGLDISRTTQLVSLLGRNVGIEVGQAVVILITFPALFLLSRTRWYQPVFVAGSVALAAVSMIWVAERVFDADYGVNKWVDELVSWPRSLIICIVATGIAAALLRAEGGRDADRAGSAEESVPAG